MSGSASAPTTPPPIARLSLPLSNSRPTLQCTADTAATSDTSLDVEGHHTATPAIAAAAELPTETTERGAAEERGAADEHAKHHERQQDEAECSTQDDVLIEAQRCSSSSGHKSGSSSALLAATCTELPSSTDATSDSPFDAASTESSIPQTSTGRPLIGL